MRKTLWMIGISLLLCGCSGVQTGSSEDRFVDSLLAEMTLDEKIGQLNQLDPTYDTERKEQLIRDGMVGSILNGVGSEEVNRLQRMAVEESRLGIPLLVGRDVIHGFHTIYPIPLGQAATWHPELVEQAAALTADEAVAAGVRWAFSPMVDVARDPRWGRVAEGYGEDSYLASVMAAAVVRGYQSHGMAACVKHFAGYSASEGGRDYNATWIPEVQLRDVYLPPFKAALDAGAMSVMCSFNTINGMPSSANKHLNIDILRDEWQSDALLVSDWGSGMDLIPHGLCADRKEAALRCIEARMEMDMQGELYTEWLKTLVEEGKVEEEQIDACVRSVLRMKYRLGMFEDWKVESRKSKVEGGDSLAAELAAESAVLLKNEGVLPIGDWKVESRKSKVESRKWKILVTGPMADQKREQLGTWVFDGEPERSVTPLEAMRAFSIQHSAFSIQYEPGLQYSRDTSRKDFGKVIEAAKRADVVLFFGGEEAILSGEARCRAELGLPGAQSELLEALHKTGKPVVLIVMAGRPLTIGEDVAHADAVVYAFHGGTMAGEGIVRVLTGEVNPSGRLPMSFPKMVGQIPFYYNRLNTGRPCSKEAVLMDDIPVDAPQFSIGASSYWLESKVEPLYPFGYGLSYTRFEYGESKVESRKSKDEWTVSCDITNTGERDGYEVAQLYVRQRSGSLARPIEELKGFERVFIPAGETRTVSFTIKREDLGYWHEEHRGMESRVWFATDDVDFDLWIAPHAGMGGE